jgi:hypothetical protein
LIGVSIEQRIIEAVKALLVTRVNELLEEAPYAAPLIEFSKKKGAEYYMISPDIQLTEGEQSEKDRIVKLFVYTLIIAFTVWEEPIEENAGERKCYGYAAAVDEALLEDRTLGGIAERAALVKKTYKAPITGKRNWEVMLEIKVTVEK